MKRSLRVIHVLLTLFAVCTCVYLLFRERTRRSQEETKAVLDERFSTHADFPLRQFLGVKWIGGDVELPIGSDHCGVAILKFENGKFVGRSYSSKFSVQPGQSRVIPHVLFWSTGQVNVKDSMQMFGRGLFASTQGELGEFAAKLSGGLNREYGLLNTNRTHIRGYYAIGSARSNEENHAEQVTMKDGESDFEYDVRRYRHCIVMGVKLFNSSDEAFRWQTTREPADPKGN